MPATPLQQVAQDASQAAESVTHAAAQSAEQAIRQSHRAVQNGLDALAAELGEARAQGSQAFHTLMQETEGLAAQGLHAVRDRSRHLRHATVTYVQHEPVKSLLIAAATGAALMGLVAFFSRRGGSGR